MTHWLRQPFSHFHLTRDEPHTTARGSTQADFFSGEVFDRGYYPASGYASSNTSDKANESSTSAASTSNQGVRRAGRHLDVR